MESDSGFRSCGGVYSSDVANTTDYILENKCQKFDGLEWVLDDTMSLNEYRNASGLGYKTKSKAWLTGGFKYSDDDGWLTGGGENDGLLLPLQSTEKIINGVVKQGPDLPYRLAGHCTVNVGGKLFFTAGGFTYDYQSPSQYAIIQVCYLCN